MPSMLARFRDLVKTQSLTTAAGRETYATLLQLAPAFADLQASMNGARSAADILAERADLERRLLELQGDTAALRALDLAKLDQSNHALQQQIWAVQDAQEAVRAAEELRKARGDIGKTIEDEVKRIRGLTAGNGITTFAGAMSEFNIATASARGGDQDAAKLLPGLSQELLRLAADNATSREELDRVMGQTAASLEQTQRIIAGLSGNASPQSAEALIAAINSTQPNASGAGSDNSAAMREELTRLREEVTSMSAKVTAGLAQNAANTGAIKRTLENLTVENSGNVISIAA